MQTGLSEAEGSRQDFCSPQWLSLAEHSLISSHGGQELVRYSPQNRRVDYTSCQSKNESEASGQELASNDNSDFLGAKFNEFLGSFTRFVWIILMTMPSWELS